MNIVTFSSDSFILPLSTMLVSLFENNKSIDEISVYVISDGILDINKYNLNNIAKRYYRSISFIDFPENLYNYFEFKFVNKYSLGRTVNRLVIDMLLPHEVEKVLCLDSDILVCESLEELWNTNIEEYYLCGVKDCISKKFMDLIEFKNYEQSYYNAGVFLVNLKKWRLDECHKKVVEYIAKHGCNVFFHEQTIMNKVFEGGILAIHPKYNLCTMPAVFSYRELIKIRQPLNYYDEELTRESLQRPYIIHLTRCFYVRKRAWVQNSDHPYAKVYCKYFNIAFGENEQLAKENLSLKKNVLNFFIRILPRSMCVFIAGFLYNYIRPKREKKLIKNGKYIN